MEIYSNTTRFAPVCNTSSKIIEFIQSHCLSCSGGFPIRTSLATILSWQWLEIGIKSTLFIVQVQSDFCCLS
ncbi:hypothetical protein GQ55_8G078700 [Panicum hallii var. hallii]|uniref:Uncharacterized protein n=1 Tax=Panicum hallii var. hallii TaxID=1504633 RepID=A0A2T7CLU8_9POAL|nr:hypothetical protein GQ55_8G078700 [Panicum hallii var. hallii]